MERLGMLRDECIDVRRRGQVVARAACYQGEPSALYGGAFTVEVTAPSAPNGQVASIRACSLAVMRALRDVALEYAQTSYEEPG
jgi:hypothetical protein